LTPTRELTIRYLPKYRVAQTFPGGDVLLVDGDDLCFVMGFGRAPDDAAHTNAVLVREGTKSFKTPAGEYLQTEAFTNAGLSRDEIAVLRKAVAGFMAEAASLKLTNAVLSRASGNPAAPSQEPPVSAAADEFLAHKMRARDDSPYIQFLLAKDYLQGIGTAKDEKLGLEWMQRAAANGSGDAKAYLQNAKQK
jgi:TPR repeat protein